MSYAARDSWTIPTIQGGKRRRANPLVPLRLAQNKAMKCEKEANRLSLFRFNRRIPCLAFVAFGIAAIVSPDAGSAQFEAKVLSKAECEFIETYDQENDSYNFASDFAYMAHTLDLTADDCSESCSAPLRKRTLDIDVSFVPSEDAQIEAFLQALVNFELFAEDTTGLSVTIRPLLEPNVGKGGTIVFFAVDKSNMQVFLELFSGHTSLNRLIRAAILPDTTCFASFPKWNDVSEPALAFINAEHYGTPEKIASCVREEAFNSLGLVGDPQGDQSLFTDLRWRGPEWPAPGFFVYGDRDYVMMRLLYRPDFEIGQGYEETLSEVNEIIDLECRR
ncbi:DUF2927 domain-containing protein [Pelagimonas sp. KU-00592-HH]|uniref:DUF2927 domain-containing protein n=1 Tax=Pelagimonas sp. KU-00592-HH TaxID=3127651 RepID=UPI00333FEFA5